MQADMFHIEEVQRMKSSNTTIRVMDHPAIAGKVSQQNTGNRDQTSRALVENE